MKVTIDKIVRSEKDTKFGKRTSVGIKTVEETLSDIDGNDVDVSDKWINYLHDPEKSDVTETWSDGDNVELRVKQNGEYLNFSPNQESKGSGGSLLDRVRAIEEHLGLNKESDDV